MAAASSIGGVADVALQEDCAASEILEDDEDHLFVVFVAVAVVVVFVIPVGPCWGPSFHAGAFTSPPPNRCLRAVCGHDHCHLRRRRPRSSSGRVLPRQGGGGVEGGVFRVVPLEDEDESLIEDRSAALLFYTFPDGTNVSGGRADDAQAVK